MNNCGHLSIRPNFKEEGGLCIECRKYVCNKCKITYNYDIESNLIGYIEKDRYKEIKRKISNLQHLFTEIENILFSSIELFKINDKEGKNIAKFREKFENIKDLYCICEECCFTLNSSSLTKCYNKIIRTEAFHDNCKKCNEWKETLYIKSINGELFFICVDCDTIWTKNCEKDNNIKDFNNRSEFLTILDGLLGELDKYLVTYMIIEAIHK